MTDPQVKAIMAAILMTAVEPPEDEEICILDVAASMAEELFQHVMYKSGQPLSSNVSKTDLAN